MFTYVKVSECKKTGCWMSVVADSSYEHSMGVQACSHHPSRECSLSSRVPQPCTPACSKVWAACSAAEFNTVVRIGGYQVACLGYGTHILAPAVIYFYKGQPDHCTLLIYDEVEFYQV
jgi:hypothetical protein